MKNLPFDTIGIESDELQALEETYKALKAKFNIALPGDIDLHINKFELFNNNPNTSVGDTLILNSSVNSCYLTFIKTAYSLNVGGRGGDSQTGNYCKYQAWAFVNLSTDFGRVLIRKKTFADTIIALFQPVSLKFKDDNAFNSEFYVVANDKEKAVSAMTPDFRKVVMAISNNDLLIEIVNNTLIVGNNKPINPAQVVYTAEVAYKLALLSSPQGLS